MEIDSIIRAYVFSPDSIKNINRLANIPLHSWTAEKATHVMRTVSTFITMRVVPTKFHTTELWVKVALTQPYMMDQIPSQFLTYDLYRSIVSSDPKLLTVIPPHMRSEELCMIALNGECDNLMAAVPAEIQTEDLICSVIGYPSQKGGQLKHVNIQTNRICKLAVSRHPEDLLYVENQTQKICLMALRALNGITGLISDVRHTAVFNMIRNQTNTICHAALLQSPEIMLYIRDQNEKLCVDALKATIKPQMVLSYIRNQTLQICLAACCRDFQCLEQIRNHIMRELVTCAIIADRLVSLREIDLSSLLLVEICEAFLPKILPGIGLRFARPPTVSLTRLWKLATIIKHGAERPRSQTSATKL